MIDNCSDHHAASAKALPSLGWSVTSAAGPAANPDVIMLAVDSPLEIPSIRLNVATRQVASEWAKSAAPKWAKQNAAAR